jgi:hypothetical protein
VLGSFANLWTCNIARSLDGVLWGIKFPTLMHNLKYGVRQDLWTNSNCDVDE